MNFVAMSALQGLLLLFILSGLVFGIFRGFGKSVIRLIVVIAMAVITFFVVPAISKTVLDANISGLGLQLFGVNIVSVQEGIIELLQRIKFVEELMGASPTFQSLINAVPLVLLNIVFFLIVFYLFKAISLLISWPCYKIFLKKVPKEERKPHRLLGGLVGAVQGIFVFAVLMVPVFGVMKIGNIAKKYNVLEMQIGQTANVEVENEPDMQSMAAETMEQENDDAEMEEMLKNVQTQVDQFNNLAFVKVFGFFGFRQLGEKVFDSFTTMNINNEKVSLTKEVEVVCKVGEKYSSFEKLSFDPEKSDLENMRFVVNTMFDSRIFSLVVGELVPYVATEWNDETHPFAFSIGRPSVPEQVQKFFDIVLKELETATGKSIKTDLLQSIMVYEIASSNGLLKVAVEGGDNESAMKKFGDEALLAEIIGAMAESNTLRATLPEFVQTGLNFVYPVLSIPKNAEERKNLFYEQILTACELVRGKTVEGTDEEEIKAKKTAELALRLRFVFDRFGFAPMLVFEETDPLFIARETYFSDLATAAISLTAQPSIEEIETYLTSHSLDWIDPVEGPLEFNFATAIDNGEVNLKTSDEIIVSDRKLSQEEWEEERHVIAKLFAGIVETFTGLENGEGSAREKFAFESLASTFDSLRESKLFEDDSKPVSDRVSFQLVKSFLQSNLLNEISASQKLIHEIEEGWDSINFADKLEELEDILNLI